jgi:hypothetical protein
MGLIIQTIRPDPTGSDQIDEASNVSRPDRSGADQIDVERQATDLAVGVRIPRGPPFGSTSVMARPGHVGVWVTVLSGIAATAMPGSAGWSGRPRPAGRW